MNVPPAIIGGGSAAIATYELPVAAGRHTFISFLDDARGTAAHPPAAPVGWIGTVRSLVDLPIDTAFIIPSPSPATRRIIASWAATRGVRPPDPRTPLR